MANHTVAVQPNVKSYFLGASTKLRKAATDLVMSVRLPFSSSIRIEQLGSHWTDYHEF